MRGRKPELRVIEGSRQDYPEPPDCLDEDGRLEWERVAPEMVRNGTLTDSVMSSLEAYCGAVAAVRRCQRRIALDGDFVETKTGLRRHPAYQIMAGMITEMRRLSAELGLTRGRPAAGAAPSAPQDDLFTKLGIV